MHIFQQTGNAQELWSGHLESNESVSSADFEDDPIGSTFGIKGDTSPNEELVKVSIGKPFQWEDGVLLGENWQRPVGGDRHYLVKLAFTLSTRPNIEISSASFGITLNPQKGSRAVIFDAFPKEILDDKNVPVTLGIGPDFKIGTNEFSVAKAETTIDFGSAIPVIQTEGLQESTFIWHYKSMPKHPLKGCREMYGIVSVPDKMERVLCRFSLLVESRSLIGKVIFWTVPQKDEMKLNWVIGPNHLSE